MTPERWRQIKPLLLAALDREPSERHAFLDKECAGDKVLQDEVKSILEAHERMGTFLEEPALEVEAKNLAEDREAQGDTMATNALPSRLPHNAPTWLDNSGAQASHQHEGLEPGKLLDRRYLIERELGRGNIGVVYRALDHQLHNKPVAIKVLLEKSLQNPWFKKKLAQEVEALSRIDHPGIVEVLDRGETPDNNPFLVMKFVSGRTLRSLIENGRLELQQVAEIVRQIGRALSAAHDQNVIHCDLKPENIMLQTLAGNEQQIKIVDFGVAKVRNSQVAAEAAGTLVAGTPGYIAPEHAAGRPTAASDIFSFGVVAYELLTGEHPFIPQGTIKKPRELRPELSIAAEEIVLRALSLEQEDRYQQARDFGELLAQALTTDLELPSREANHNALHIEMAYVLFMDIVGYSKLTTDDESQIYKEFQEVVSGTDSFRQAKASRQMISRSIGDGIALVFFNNPRAPVQCAFEIARAVRLHPHIQLRMGINNGPVYRVKDMNEVEDVAGAGINMAQRVMDCGDAGHILASKSAADVLEELADWRNDLHVLGEHRVKHGVKVHLFNVYNSEVGNPKLPKKLRKRGWLFVAAIAVILGVVMLTAWPAGFLSASSSPPPPPPLVASGVERSLSYSVLVRKSRDGRPFEEPFQLASADVVFEKDYRLKLNFSSQQAGYFYVLNEPPAQNNGVPGFIVLHASSNSDNDPALLNTELPKDTWLIFDDKKGTEKLWLVWSAQKVAELDAVKGLDNPRDKGRVTDVGQAKAIYEFLKSRTASAPAVVEDKGKKVTRISVKGEVLVYSFDLQHQ